MGLIAIQKKDGFTLIELLVVVLILSLLLSITTVYFKKKTDVYGEAGKIASYIRYLRSKAVHENKKVTMILDVENKQYYQEGDSHRRSIDKLIDIEVIAEDSAVTRKNIRLDFSPDGSSTGLQLTLFSPQKRFVLEVSWLTGTVRVKYAQG